MGASHGGQREFPQFRLDIQLDHPPEHIHGVRPAVHLDMRLDVALGQIGHRRFRCGRPGDAGPRPA